MINTPALRIRIAALQLYSGTETAFPAPAGQRVGLLAGERHTPMDEQLVRQMAEQLRAMPPIAELPARTRPMNTLWDALNQTLLELRLPLYHVYLTKPAPKPGTREAALQCGFAYLGAFAYCTGTNQAIITSLRGHPRSISFQPRTDEFNWTAEHAISGPDDSMLTRGPNVGIEDVLFLAAKVSCAFGGYQAGHAPDYTATFTFGRPDLGVHKAGDVRLVVRELHGKKSRRAALKKSE